MSVILHKYTNEVSLIKDVDQTYILKQSKSFKDEIYALTHLNHPSIPQLYSWYPRGPLKLQFMPGISLSHIRFSQEDIAPVFLQLCDVISYVHGKGFYHNDLKPTNIVFQQSIINLR
jgi:serine/threonine protein kinase